MISTAEFRNGMTLDIEGQIWQIVEFQHVNPGKGGAFVRTKLKNILTGRVLEKTFRSGEKVEEIKLYTEPHQYLYHDGDLYYFMHTKSYEQVPVNDSVVGDAKQWLKENIEVGLVLHGAKVIGIEIPKTIEVLITKSEPGVQGDRAQGGTKPAVVETGATVQVPLFVNEGERIRVDTRSGQYLERA